MKTSNRAAFTFFCLLFVCSGCSSLENYTITAAPARAAIVSGDFQTALLIFPENSAKGRNEILTRLERATILQNQGLFEESSLEFEKAVNRMRESEERAVISATRTAAQTGTLIVNEQVMPYEGADFEKIMLHALNAVNYLMRGDLEGARVEVRRAYRRQEELAAVHEKKLEEARRKTESARWKESLEQADKTEYDSLNEKSSTVLSVYHNAFASYVSALVYELNNEPDEAYIDMKKAYQAYPSSRAVQADLIRLSRKLGFREDTEQWERAFGVPEPVSPGGVDVFVLFCHGLAPFKEPLSLPIPIHNGFVFASMPLYRFTPSEISGALVRGGSVETGTSTVCDIDAMAARNLMDDFPVLFVKQIARSYLKAQAVRSMAREHGGAGAFLGTLFSAVTEQADLRTWSTLPKQIQVARLFAPRSVSEITISPVPTGRTATVPIPQGARHMIVWCRYTDAGLSIHTKSY